MKAEKKAGFSRILKSWKVPGNFEKKTRRAAGSRTPMVIEKPGQWEKKFHILKNRSIRKKGEKMENS